MGTYFEPNQEQCVSTTLVTNETFSDENKWKYMRQLLMVTWSNFVVQIIKWDCCPKKEPYYSQHISEIRGRDSGCDKNQNYLGRRSSLHTEIISGKNV